MWLLDVDGVINVNRPAWGAAPSRGYAYDAGHEYRLRWSATLIGRIRTIQRSGVEIRWASTWCAAPSELTRVLHLDAPSVLTREQAHPDLAPAAKLAVASSVLAEGRPLVWTDDECLPPAGHPLFDTTTPHLLVAPHPRRGLTPEHLDYITAWTARHLTV